MVAGPAPKPVAIPVVAPTVATVRLLLLHVPPKVGSDNIEMRPTHKTDVPDMGAGRGLTNIGNVIVHPVGSVYEINAEPDDTPVTIPVVASTEAMVAALLLHVPPPASVKSVVEPTQTVDEPEIAGGIGFTVTGNVAIHPEPIV